MPDAPAAFFSYSREDQDFALRLAGDLKAAGAVVWIDQLDIPRGQRWDRAVQSALNNCPRMLVILSPSSVDSENVLDEIDLALEKHKTIIPVFYRDCEIPLRLRRVQHIDFRNDYDRGLKVVLKDLGVEQAMAASAAAVPATPKEARPALTDTTVRRLTEHWERELDRRLAAERARLEEERKQAAEQARLEEEKRQAAAEKARLEHEERERQAAAERASLEEEKKQVAAEKARLEREQRERQAAAEKARLEEEQRRAAAEKARLEQEERERQAAAEQARLEQEERERQAAAEKARLEQEERERQAAAEQARLEQEERERQAAAEKARLEEEKRRAAEKARLEQEERERQAAAEKARLEREERVRRAFAGKSAQPSELESAVEIALRRTSRPAAEQARFEEDKKQADEQAQLEEAWKRIEQARLEKQRVEQGRMEEERGWGSSLLTRLSRPTPGQPVAADVPIAFVSYSNQDSDFALRLGKDLKDAGAAVWIDRLDILPGMPWDRAVSDALTKCPRMLVILSPDAVKSSAVRDEISFALNSQKSIIPALYRECDIPIQLERYQRIDFRNDYHRGLKVLLKDLGGEPRARLEQEPKTLNLRELRTLKGHTDVVGAVAVTLDGQRAVSASWDETLKVWDLASGRELRTLAAHTGQVTGVAVTPDGRHAVSASDELKVWELASGRELRTLTGHSEGGVSAVAVTPDGQRAVSASLDGTRTVWDLGSGRELRTLTGHAGVLPWVNAVVVTPDGQRAVSASNDCTLKVWELDSGRELRTLTGHSTWGKAVAVTPDGQLAVSASQKELKVWELGSGRQLHTLDAAFVTAVAVTPDGQLAVSASGDRTLKVWDLGSGRQLLTFNVNAQLYCCAVCPDGKTILAGDEHGVIHVLRLE